MMVESNGRTVKSGCFGPTEKPNALVATMIDDTMSPRFEKGEQITARTDREAKRGDFVLAIVSAGDGNTVSLVRQLARCSSRVVRLEQLNPPQTLVLSRARLVGLHPIVLWGDAS
jgi:phage repressor protein C with HTH and peptisase S24 domain